MTSCDWCLDLFVINKSTDDIVVFVKGKTTFTEDTLLSVDNYDFYTKSEISPQETSDVFGEVNGCRTWKEYYRNHKLKKYIYLFVVDADTVANYSWSEICERNLILVRYDLTYKDVDLFSPLSYPPTPEMRDIKMWPPYSTFEDK